MTDMQLIQHALMKAKPGQSVEYFTGNLAMVRDGNPDAAAVGKALYDMYLDGVIDLAQIATGKEKTMPSGGPLREFRYMAVKLPLAGIEKRSAKRREADKYLAEIEKIRVLYKGKKGAIEA